MPSLPATRGCGEALQECYQATDWLLEIFWCQSSADTAMTMCWKSANTGLKKKEAWLYLKLSIQSGIQGRLWRLRRLETIMDAGFEALLLASVFTPAGNSVSAISRGTACEH